MAPTLQDKTGADPPKSNFTKYPVNMHVGDYVELVDSHLLRCDNRSNDYLPVWFRTDSIRIALRTLGSMAPRMLRSADRPVDSPAFLQCWNPTYTKVSSIVKGLCTYIY